jgi:hypothetical protein
MEDRADEALMVEGVEVLSLIESVEPPIGCGRLRAGREKLPGFGFLYFVEEGALSGAIFQDFMHGIRGDPSGNENKQDGRDGKESLHGEAFTQTKEEEAQGDGYQ